MISDFVTNTIYFSERLTTDSRFKETSDRIFSLLDSFNATFKLLPDTNDIWARDYMPIQIDDSSFVEYRYDPDYLQGHWKGFRNLKTYPDIVCNSLNLNTIKSDLIMDGGNFVKSSDCIILTEKIIEENRLSYSKKELTEKLQNTFHVDKVITIPWDKLEEYGHSDGILRFIDNKTVLITILR
jgi:agmatine deiminase